MPPLAHRSLLLASLSANPGLRLRARRLPRSVAMSQMSCRHLLIKFSGSRNPVSRRTGESTASVTAEDALHELEEHAKKIRAEGSTEAVFAKYATQRSDCGSYAKVCGRSTPFLSTPTRRIRPRHDAEPAIHTPSSPAPLHQDTQLLRPSPTDTRRPWHLFSRHEGSARSRRGPANSPTPTPAVVAPAPFPRHQGTCPPSPLFPFQPPPGAATSAPSAPGQCSTNLPTHLICTPTFSPPRHFPPNQPFSGRRPRRLRTRHAGCNPNSRRAPTDSLLASLHIHTRARTRTRSLHLCTHTLPMPPANT